VAEEAVDVNMWGRGLERWSGKKRKPQMKCLGKLL
jgi:hypothetical protein